MERFSSIRIQRAVARTKQGRARLSLRAVAVTKPERGYVEDEPQHVAHPRGAKWLARLSQLTCLRARKYLRTRDWPTKVCTKELSPEAVGLFV